MEHASPLREGWEFSRCCPFSPFERMPEHSLVWKLRGYYSWPSSILYENHLSQSRNIPGGMWVKIGCDVNGLNELTTFMGRRIRTAWGAFYT